MRIAIDTNRYVNFVKGLPEAAERLRRADEILVPFVVVGELRAGFAGGASPSKPAISKRPIEQYDHKG